MLHPGPTSREAASMTAHAVAIVAVIASTVIMSVVSLTWGCVRRGAPAAESLPLNSDGRPGDRPRHSPLHY